MSSSRQMVLGNAHEHGLFGESYHGLSPHGVKAATSACRAKDPSTCRIHGGKSAGSPASSKSSKETPAKSSEKAGEKSSKHSKHTKSSSSGSSGHEGGGHAGGHERPKMGEAAEVLKTFGSIIKEAQHSGAEATVQAAGVEPVMQGVNAKGGHHLAGITHQSHGYLTRAR